MISGKQRDQRNRTRCFQETRNGQGVYFAQTVDRETSLYEHVFAYGSNAGQDGVIIATRAKKQFGENGDRFLVLENGVRYEGVRVNQPTDG
ncbi:MAG: hypothetical protein Ct9H300mP16_11970 [Pseudomonadota bacterium]|nr:MAG: hypothetical protein Ct9H300mP16_11970 [Pseudomonadota bacterium]